MIAVANQNNAAASARAFATYALVPYLGILFVPGALLLSSVSVLNSYRLKQPSQRGAALGTMLVATLELAAQLALWWILYKVPQWSQAINGTSL
jgi:hypothetical protein